jgi:tetratricopeptide (TPR) repeat protein
MNATRCKLAKTTIAILLLYAAPNASRAQTGSFSAPPRTIAGITAILDQDKPDPARITKWRTDADAQPADAAGAETLSKFYFDRARARRLIGRIDDALTDCEKAIQTARPQERFYIQNYLLQLLNLRGEPRQALVFLAELEREYDRPGFTANLFNIYKFYKWQIEKLLVMGNIGQSEAILRKSEALLRQSRSWPNGMQHQSDFGWQTEEPRARILEARGRFKEAEEA